MSEHEGASIWTDATSTGLAKRLKLEVRRAITPNTDDLLAIAQEQPTFTYREVQERLAVKLTRDLRCPARHRVFPLELRVTVTKPDATGALARRIFPNLDGFPVKYLPVRAYFCPVCQELYRQREIDEAFELAEQEAAHA